jgi:hypothetical protein
MSKASYRIVCTRKIIVPFFRSQKRLDLGGRKQDTWDLAESFSIASFSPFYLARWRCFLPIYVYQSHIKYIHLKAVVTPEARKT